MRLRCDRQSLGALMDNEEVNYLPAVCHLPLSLVCTQMYKEEVNDLPAVFQLSATCLSILHTRRCTTRR